MVSHASRLIAALEAESGCHSLRLEKRFGETRIAGQGMLDEPLDYEAWTICGSTYHVILKKDIVTDAVKADHSKTAPSFLGSCEQNGKPMGGTLLAILKANSDAAAKLPATAAWRIDAKKARFAAMDPAGLMCSRDGIATVDGGK